MNSAEMFKSLLEKFHQHIQAQGREEYDCKEMEQWVMMEAHQMCRKGEITWEMFGRVMDEAICW